MPLDTSGLIVLRTQRALEIALRSQAQTLEEASLPERSPRIEIDVPDGVVLIGSDGHIWPGYEGVARRAFRHMVIQLRPEVICFNGDMLDGARISRFPSIGWEKKPELVEEVGACQAYLRSVQKVAGDARLIWTLGNHDLRFETLVATRAPELVGVEGVHLKDHFPEWEPAWALWLNPGRRPVCVKHRFKGGTHAGHNNTLYSGVTTLTGHDHMLKVTPFADYWGVRYGVQTGTLAVPYGPQFVHYTEDNPVNWTSGFVVLTFRDGRLLWPEIVHVVDEATGLVEFRGEVLSV